MGVHAVPPGFAQPTSIWLRTLQRMAQRGPSLALHGPCKGGRAGAAARLERLDHARHHLVLQAGVLALGVLADGDQVDVVVARLVARQREARSNIRVQLPQIAQVRPGARASRYCMAAAALTCISGDRTQAWAERTGR